jgi:EAL domain-containing protein (putative c-di-GMP-specific phosphodiesterase class I)
MASGSIDTNEVLDPRSLLQRVADQVLEVVEGAGGVLVGLSDDSSVTFITGSGFLKPHVGTSVQISSSLAGLAITTREVVRCDDTGSDDRVDAEACRRLGVASSVCVPLLRGHEALGVMSVSSQALAAFNDHDVALLAKLADFLGVAVGLAGDLGRVQRDLLLFGRPSPEADLEQMEAHDRTRVNASRFVMNVLRPEAVFWMESRRRVQAVLDNPEQLAVVFQPIVELSSNAIVAVEALARFRAEPARGPDAWFAEAEQAGIGVELELLAVANALVARRLLPNDVALTVNVGPAAVVSPGLRQMLRAAGAACLVVELTEHTKFDDYDALLHAVGAIRESGVQLSVDDAGAGFSGLSHILKLSPDFIKLDRELIKGVDTDPVRRALTASMVGFAAGTRAKIIAEGIETADELEAVRALGVGYAQGYFLGRPVPLADLDFARHRPAQLAPAR